MSLLLELKAQFTKSLLLRGVRYLRLNHWLIWLLCVVGCVLALSATWHDHESIFELILAGLKGALAVYGVSALVRELVIEDDIVTPIAAIACLWVIWSGREWSVLMLFAALAQVRMINRINQSPATILDSSLVVALTITAMIYNENMLFWLTGTVALVLDAVLRRASIRQWLFAAICLAAGLYHNFSNMPLMRELGFFVLPSVTVWLLPLSVLYLVAGWLAAATNARVTDTPQARSKSRIRAGMIALMLCAVLPFFHGNLGLLAASFVWIALGTASAGYVLQLLLPKQFGVRR
jgi:hypothetical protein